MKYIGEIGSVNTFVHCLYITLDLVCCDGTLIFIPLIVFHYFDLVECVLYIIMFLFDLIDVI